MLLLPGHGFDFWLGNQAGFPDGAAGKKKKKEEEEEAACQCRRLKRCGVILGGEDPLEEEMATLSSVLAWRIPWTGELGGGVCGGEVRVRGVTESQTQVHD